eukprot:29650-Chlamydomonas_euryale.AAC.1
MCETVRRVGWLRASAVLTSTRARQWVVSLGCSGKHNHLTGCAAWRRGGCTERVPCCMGCGLQGAGSCLLHGMWLSVCGAVSALLHVCSGEGVGSPCLGSPFGVGSDGDLRRAIKWAR